MPPQHIEYFDGLLLEHYDIGDLARVKQRPSLWSSRPRTAWLAWGKKLPRP